MEYIPATDSQIVTAFVEVVPGKLYWVAADVPRYSRYARCVHKTGICRPSIYPNKTKLPRSVPDGKQNGELIDIPVVPDKHTDAAGPSVVEAPESSPSCSPRFVHTDKLLVYRPLSHDFGPLDLPTTIRYIRFIDQLQSENVCVIHMSDYKQPEHCANSATLCAIYAVVKYGLDASKIQEVFAVHSGHFLPLFRDASHCNTSNTLLGIHDICSGIQQSIRHKWIDWDNFDIQATESLQSVENGDVNWIIQGKFLAFAGPSADKLDEDGIGVHPPSHYVPIFKQFGVSDIVRLNVSKYDSKDFLSKGFAHHDLFFEDGSCPSMQIVMRFLEICNRATGAVAVHCKAGLGRTATLIGVAVMKQYKVTAKEFMGWARVARPGSVIGSQQDFLLEMEQWLNHPSTHLAAPTRRLPDAGECGQGSRLLRQKRRYAKPTESHPQRRKIKASV